MCTFTDQCLPTHYGRGVAFGSRTSVVLGTVILSFVYLETATDMNHDARWFFLWFGRRCSGWRASVMRDEYNCEAFVAR